MNINLDDNKIVKVIYRLDDSRVVDFNYKDGTLQSVTTSFSPKAEVEKPKLDVMSDEEMIEAVKKSDFMNELKAAKKRYKLAKEIAENFTQTDETQTRLGDKKKKDFSDESVDIIKQIIKLDENGTLDEIAKKNIGKIDNVISTPYQIEGQAYDIDIDVCERSIQKVKDEIMKSLNNINLEDTSDRQKLLDVIKAYQEYMAKKIYLLNEKWNATTKKIQE